jgi:hypothetical protein
VANPEQPRESRARAVIIGTGRRAIRQYGITTARWRPDPDFLVIGAKRGGSTSFYFDLLQHEQLCPLFPKPDHLPKAAATKGIHYFDQNYPRGEQWYRSHLPSTRARSRLAKKIGAPVLTGEASPYYLYHPAAAGRAHELLPDAKLIAVLRDPVMRTYSHWKERRRQGSEPLEFIEALAAEDARLGDSATRLLAEPEYHSYAHEQQSYAHQSEYDTALAAWLAHYPRTQLLVLASEDYYRAPQDSLDRAADFLGLRPQRVVTGEVRNAAAGKDLDPALRARLAARFAPHNHALEQLTG